MGKSVQLGFALLLMAGAPVAFGQKMYKCPDGKGGTTFQQEKCAETEAEADKRNKERELREAEAKKKKEEEERRKAETIEKAKERDKAFLEQQEARRKIEEAEKKTLEVNKPATSADEGGLPEHVSETYPGPWKEGNNTIITNAFSTKTIAGCSPYRYRQRSGGGQGEFLVQCKTGGVKKNHYFVWPASGAVYGPVQY